MSIYSISEMELESLSKLIPDRLIEIFSKEGIKKLTPSQEKSIKAGLLESKNLLVCTPTASGKTLIAEIAAGKQILEGKGKAVYIVPLVALANEKFKDFKRRYEGLFKVALSVGDFDGADPQLLEYDLIICTAEKLDSLIRHQANWLGYVSLVVIDEIHLLNDIDRGPTLEILITIVKQMLPKAQILGLSATIGNPHELGAWLDAAVIEDSWRPVPLHKGIYYDGEVEFEEG